MCRSYFQNIDHFNHASKNRASKFITAMLLLISSVFSLAVQGADFCEVKMGYRLMPKIIYISTAPDNVGMYQDWFKSVAVAIGCQSAVIRLPKKRFLQKMRLGEFDFYPSFARSQERNQSTEFFDLVNFVLKGMPVHEWDKIKLHQNCCGEPTAMTTGFAINSPNFSNGIARRFSDVLKTSQLSINT